MTGISWVSFVEYLPNVQATRGSMALTTLIASGIPQGVLKASEQSRVQGTKEERSSRLVYL